MICSARHRFCGSENILEWVCRSSVRAVHRPIVPDVVAALEQVGLPGKRPITVNRSVQTLLECVRKLVPSIRDLLRITGSGMVLHPVELDVRVAFEEVAVAGELPVTVP